MNPSLRIGVALHPDRLPRPLACARVGLGPLTAHRKTPEVANSAVAFDTLEPLEVHAQFAAQIALDHILAVLNRVHNLRNLLLVQILGPDTWINLGVLQDCLRIHRTNAIDVAQGYIDPLFSGNINT